MSNDLTPDQIKQLQSLGLLSKPQANISKGNKIPIIPLLSISGLTFLSFGGLILFKSKESPIITPPSINTTSPRRSLPGEGGTQVPKSIQHYLLTSQQFFTQALEFQAKNDSPMAIHSLNQSVTIATEAITLFPQDYRVYEQRGRIYLSLVDSQPAILPNAIADLTKALELNPNSAEITRTLAGVYAKQGDAQNTLNYLSKTVSLEPTKAQNFYDLARLQQQAGQLPQALDTYTKLLTIITDPSQKSAIETEKSALEKLASQAPDVRVDSLVNPSPASDQPLLQAGLPATAELSAGLIIAAPETTKDITVKNQTDSNSYSGSSIIPNDTQDITIENSKLSSTSQIYVTITKGGKNQNLQVKSKSDNSFTVGIDQPINETIEFKWWIVN